MKKNVAISLLFSLLASTAAAQFTGPSTTGKATSVAQVSAVRPGSYVSVTGNIVAHQREKYYTFRDETGEIRVEIENRAGPGCLNTQRPEISGLAAV